MATKYGAIVIGTGWAGPSNAGDQGKTAREAAGELGKERVSNERKRMSQCFRSLDPTPIFPLSQQ